MTNEKNKLLTGHFSFMDKIASLTKKDEKNDGLDSLSTVTDEVKEEKPETPEEEYIWVEGYKGTDRNMKCRDYQYELGKKFSMPEDAEIEVCDSGFHLCPELGQVFDYYSIGNGNRFFKVMALVPKKQTENKIETTWFGVTYEKKPEKYAAKEIIFMSECTPDEIFAVSRDAKDFTDEEKLLALEIGIAGVLRKRKINTLTLSGYSEAMAEYIVHHNLTEKANVLATQENISWDTRISILFGFIKN